MKIGVLLIFASATISMTSATGSADVVRDYTGEYFIREEIRLAILSLINKDAYLVFDLLEKLKISDVPSSHIPWIQELYNAIISFKEIIEHLKLKTIVANDFDYAVEDIIAMAKEQKKMNNIGNFRHPLVFLNLTGLTEFASKLSNNDIDLANLNYDGFKINYGFIMRKYEDQFLSKMSVERKMSSPVSDLWHAINGAKTRIIDIMDYLKELIRRPQLAATFINFNIKAIYNYQVEVNIMPTVQEINSNLTHIGDINEIQVQMGKIKTELVLLNQAMETFSLILKHVLSADPTMLYDKDETKEIIAHLHSVRYSVIKFQDVQLKNCESNKKWLTSFIEFFDVSGQFLLQVNIEICVLNDKELNEYFKTINTNKHLSTPDLVKFNSNVNQHFQFIKRLVRKPRKLLPNFQHDYAMIFTRQNQEIIEQLTFQQVTVLNEIIEKYTKQMMQLIEQSKATEKPLKTIEKTALDNNKHVMESFNNLRKRILSVIYQINNLECDRRSFSGYAAVVDNIVKDPIDERMFDGTFLKMIDDVDRKLRKANECHKAFQRELEQFFESKSRAQSKPIGH